ncbi:uncharacterized protein E0L32_006217 [Thyridium curvatum]|uniref:Cytochrome P450 n=1 Tax=Thyridium curvatum TaxID=1093900 RepID=A0A507B183_9PEZI|nr:uncharacterized protein E0L32_006217 [Thyridium curvatum]TPX13487.1 hypothetical protein E0L32_006217 [Thyridium curvatum]
MFEILGLSGASSLALVGRLVLYSLLPALCYGFYNLYINRMMFRRIQKEHGTAMLPHSFLFGHLWIIAKVGIKYKMPPDTHGQCVPLLLALEYPEIAGKGAVYMDTWPMYSPMLAVYHPDMMAQFTQDASQEKHWRMLEEFKPFTDNMDLVTSGGQVWKTDRNMFNPGFSTRNLMSLIPHFVEEVVIFRDKLLEKADTNEKISLEEYTTNATVDIICRAVFGQRVQAQTREVPFITAMLKQVPHLTPHPGTKMFNPFRPYLSAYWKAKFREGVMPIIQDAIKNYEKHEGPKTILNLAVRSYVNEVQDYSARGNIPPEFAEMVVNHTKMFLFAGHDTTATTLCYAYMFLHRNPDKLAKLRAELDEVLGPDPAAAPARISADPSLLNQLPYTLAVVKETLRINPPVGTVRTGAPGFSLTHPETGERFPCGGLAIFGCSKAAHLHPDYWPEPQRFLPERFMTTAAATARGGGEEEEADPLLHPRRNAFRPWEMGPRNCIGQELASLELRLVLALTAREVDVELAYAPGAPTFMGEVAYQVETPEHVTSHPKDGLPVRIRSRKHHATSS